MSSGTKSHANSIKRKFIKLYPDAKVGIDAREGWMTVNDKKAINMSQASGSPLTDEEMIDKLHAVYAGEAVDSDVATSTSSMDTYHESINSLCRALYLVEQEEKENEGDDKDVSRCGGYNDKPDDWDAETCQPQADKKDDVFSIEMRSGGQLETEEGVQLFVIADQGHPNLYPEMEGETVKVVPVEMRPGHIMATALEKGSHMDAVIDNAQSLGADMGEFDPMNGEHWLAAAKAASGDSTLKNASDVAKQMEIMSQYLEVNWDDLQLAYGK